MSLQVEQPKNDVGVAAVMKRCAAQSWSLSRVEDFGKLGRHFMDVLDSSVGKAVREALSVPRKHRSALALAFSDVARGEVICLPSSSTCRWVFLGVSWDIAPSAAAGENNSVDVAVLYFDPQGQLVGACHRGSPEALGARHGGGGLLGQGIMVDLAAAPAHAAQILLVGHFSSERLASSDGLQRLQCCVVDPLGGELVRFTLQRSPQTDRGFVAGRLLRGEAREASNATRWDFQALTTPLSGASWDTSLDEARGVFQTPLRELQPLPPDLPSTGRCLVSL